MGEHPSIAQMLVGRKRTEMPKKQVNPNQQAFDFLDTIPGIPNKYSSRPWYYVTRLRNAEMLMGFDAHGEPIWAEHDMRSGDYPHLFNCMRRAQQAATRLGGAVKSCHYDRNQKGWRPYVVG